MKTRLLLLTMISFVTISNAQIEFRKKGVSYTKMDIDTDILLATIQEKQQEIKQRVFRNTIVNEFNKSSYLEHMNNFATYNFMYQTMDVLTRGSNKAKMTKDLTMASADFAKVYALALYIGFRNKKDKVSLGFKKDGSKKVNSNNLILTKIPEIKVTRKGNIISAPDSIINFNIIIDLCLDLLINNDNIRESFEFATDLSSPSFKKWYESDNVYLKAQNNLPKGLSQKDLDIARDAIQDILIDLGKLSSIQGDIEDWIDAIDLGKNAEMSNKVEDIKKELISKKGIELANTLHEFKIKYKAQLGSETGKIDYLIDFLKEDFDTYKAAITFFTTVKKSSFTDFTLNKDQFVALQIIIKNFAKKAKDHFANNAVSKVLDFVLENSIVKFYDDNDVEMKLEVADNNDNGYLYIDVETVIYSIYSYFDLESNKGVLVYLEPYISIGTNYASFLDDGNTLTLNENGEASALGQLYFASEKIGIKYNILNLRYTRSHEAGEPFKYYNKQKNSRLWLRPQPEPLFSKVYVHGYASGLLYNIASVKSDADFNYALIGAGVGATFFNDLSVSLSYGSPFTDRKFDAQNSFVCFSMDIPIFDYLKAVRSKEN